MYSTLTRTVIVNGLCRVGGPHAAGGAQHDRLVVRQRRLHDRQATQVNTPTYLHMTIYR